MRSPPPARELDLVVGGEPVVALVRESHRAKRLRLVVRPGRPLEVTIPRRTTRTALLRFIDDNAAWLAEKLAAAREASARTPPLELERQGRAPLVGERLAIVPVAGRAAVAVRREGELHVSGRNDQAAAAIARWYRREARARLERSAAGQGARLGVTYERVAVRDQRSRWGSCSTRGTLSFNWRLVLAPAEVLEYVVVHELLHLKEPNHSRAFWRLLDLHRPGWQQQAEWLRTYGPEVLSFDTAALVPTLGA